MMDLGKRRCLQVPTHRTTPVNSQRCLLIFCRPEMEAVTPAIGIRCSLASPSEDLSENDDQSWYFLHFAALVHTL